MKKTLLFIILTLFWVLFLLPKTYLWSHVRAYAQDRGLILTSRHQKEQKMALILQGTQINYKNVHVGDIKEIIMKPYLFYNQIKMYHISLTPLKNLKIDNITTTYSLLNPQVIVLEGNSSYGVFHGKIRLFDRHGFVQVKGDKLRQSAFKKYFKKDDDGMRYEFDF